VDHIVQICGKADRFDSCDYALMLAVAHQSLQSRRIDRYGPDIALLRDREQIAQSRIMATGMYEDLDHAVRVVAQTRVDGMEAEDQLRFVCHQRLSARTKSSRVVSRSARTSFTSMRSPSRKRMRVRSPII